MPNNNKQPQGEVSKVLNSAFSGITGMFNDAKNQINVKIENYLSKIDLVKREEFEVLKEMLAECRKEQKKLNDKITKLEKSLK